MPPTAELLREFELATGGVVRDAPAGLSGSEFDLRVGLIVEEVAELICALGNRDDVARSLTLAMREAVDYWRTSMRPEDADPANVAKELADVEYVLHGTAHYAGVNLDVATAEVHRSNMSKLGDDGKPVLRGDGKVLKGPNYRPADPARLLARDAEPVGAGISRPKAYCSADDYIEPAA